MKSKKGIFESFLREGIRRIIRNAGRSSLVCISDLIELLEEAKKIEDET